MSKTVFIVAAIAAISLSGCSGTSSDWAPLAGAPLAPMPAAESTQPQKIIDNPDESHEDFDYIWADSEEAATRECQKICDRDRTIFVKVQRRSKNSKQYECHWRT